MELGRGGGDGGGGGVGRGPAPIGDDTAGAANDGDEGGDVPGVHDRVEAEVGEAGGEEEVAVAIAPGAVEADLPREAVGGGAVLVAGEVEGVAGEKGGVGEAGGRADADGAVVERGDVAVADHELAEDGLMDATEDGFAAVEKGDEGAPERDAGDEGFGAIDRVEHPGPFGAFVEVAEFLAKDAVIGEARGDEAAHELLGAAIGGGDRGGIALEIDGEVGAAEERADKIAGGLGEFDKERAEGREVHAAECGPRSGRNTRKKVGLRPGTVLVGSVGDFWTEQPIHFIDFEGSLGSGVLEYGVVTLRGAEIGETRTRLCRATGRVRAEDAELHGLDAAAVAGEAAFAEDFEVFARLRESGPLAAHFANAENTLIKAVWPYPRTSPDFARGGASAVTDWGPWVDPGRIYPQLYPGLASARLGELVAAFGLQERLDALAAERCPPERRHYHAALYDALAGALLLVRLAAEPAVAGQSMLWLLEMSTLDGERREGLRQRELF